MTEPTTRVMANQSTAGSTFQRALARSIIYPVLLLILLIVIFILQLSNISRNSQQVEHTNRVIEQASVVLKQLVDMETGLRGYLLNNDSRFLEPYQQAQTSFDSSF